MPQSGGLPYWTLPGVFTFKLDIFPLWRRCFRKLSDLNGSTTEIWYDLFTFLMDFLLRNNDNSGRRLVLFVYLLSRCCAGVSPQILPTLVLTRPWQTRADVTFAEFTSLHFSSIEDNSLPPQLMLVSVANPCSTLFIQSKFSLWRELFDPPVERERRGEQHLHWTIKLITMEHNPVDIDL